MLVQVAEGLESLHFRGSCRNSRNHRAIRRRNVDLPPMPRLKHFVNELVDLFGCGSDLEDISSLRMPLLERLALKKGWNYVPHLDDVLTNVSTRVHLFAGVTSLKLGEVYDHECLSELKLPFPRLDRLEIEARTLTRINGVVSHLEVGEVLKACEFLGLSHLGLRLLKSGDSLGNLVAGMELFKTLKSFHVEMKASPICRVDDDTDDFAGKYGIETVEQFLLKDLGGLESVRIGGIHMKPATRERLTRFIAENKLPIKFY
ncbi:uncharacterized protein LOC118435435 [Folsomia candida]|nr:uncharacterized protein LOC118435435 [Folsomia candida]